MAKRKAWQSKLTGKQKQHAREWLVPNEGLFNRALVLQRAKESWALGCTECLHIIRKLEDPTPIDNSGKCADCGATGFRVENDKPIYCIECGAKRFIPGYAEAKAKADPFIHTEVDTSDSLPCDRCKRLFQEVDLCGTDNGVICPDCLQETKEEGE